MECGMTIQCLYIMHHDQIRVTGISIIFRHLTFFCIENIQNPLYWIFANS
jgi:hypothetical protein